MATDAEIARAQALGRLAGREQASITTCPYPRTDRVLRLRWVLAYARAGGRAGLEGRARRWLKGAG